MGLSLTGYLLPWDQKGYWATDVATNIAGTLPQVGAEVKQQAVAGPDSGNLTLTRFYGLHVAILPASLILLLGAHIYIFRRHGVTSKENAEGLVNKPENEHAPGTESFWPRQAFYDMIACMIVFAVMLSLVLYGFAHKVEVPEQSWYESIARAGVHGKGAELDAAADRDTAGYPARPEWYFLFLFQLLKYFPGDYAIFGTVIIPNGVMVVLFLLPMFGIGSMRKVGHFFGMLFMVTLLVVVGLLTLKALDDDKPNGILWGIMKDKSDSEDAKKARVKAEDFQHKLHEAEILARRACQLAMPGAPVEGGHFLIRNDPLTTGQALFKQHCGSCHGFSRLESDKNKGGDWLFESWAPKDKEGLTTATAADLGDFASRQWVLGILANSMSEKHFGLVKRPVLDENDKPMKDEQGKPLIEPGLVGMKKWRDGIERVRKKEKWNQQQIDEQEKAFGHIADLLVLQQKPREDRKDEEVIKKGQDAFFDGKNKCSDCHRIDRRDPKTKKWETSTEGDGSAPDLSNYGSAEWIRAMIAAPAHKARYSARNLMPAFRQMDGQGSDLSLKLLQDASQKSQNDKVIPLSDIEREMIIRWMLRDYRPIFGGAAIAK
jgi:ubiquinol-cytochrome c reductase cytochrome b subunit